MGGTVAGASAALLGRVSANLLFGHVGGCGGCGGLGCDRARAGPDLPHLRAPVSSSFCLINSGVFHSLTHGLRRQKNMNDKNKQTAIELSKYTQ